jgi:hypothetical protein
LRRTWHRRSAGELEGFGQGHLQALGYDVGDPQALYHVSPYDDQARLAGESRYEDKTSLRIEEVDPAEATTPARVRDIHSAQLTSLLQTRGDKFWLFTTP